MRMIWRRRRRRWWCGEGAGRAPRPQTTTRCGGRPGSRSCGCRSSTRGAGPPRETQSCPRETLRQQTRAGLRTLSCPWWTPRPRPSSRNASSWTSSPRA
ncbi:hypothetical protein CRUP_000766 [Coryphaenoides rupestris]|nr:hypothetical protein CRUP_000766 [Coryphaenoides rupestris]